MSLFGEHISEALRTLHSPSDGEYCNHPELRPTRWNQPKPEPALMVGCCEDNKICTVCGWGRASYPCRCMRERNGGKP